MSLDLVNLLEEGVRQFSMAEAYLWPPVRPYLERAGIDHCWGKGSGQNALLIWFRMGPSVLCLTLLIIFYKALGKRLLGKKKVKPVGTGLSLLLASSLDLQKHFHWTPQKFVLTGNKVWHHLILSFYGLCFCNIICKMNCGKMQGYVQALNS